MRLTSFDRSVSLDYRRRYHLPWESDNHCVDDRGAEWGWQRRLPVVKLDRRGRVVALTSFDDIFKNDIGALIVDHGFWRVLSE